MTIVSGCCDMEMISSNTSYQESLSQLFASSLASNSVSLSKLSSSLECTSLSLNGDESVNFNFDMSTESCGCASSCLCRESSCSSYSITHSHSTAAVSNNNDKEDNVSSNTLVEDAALTKLAEEFGLPPLIHLRRSSAIDEFVQHVSLRTHSETTIPATNVTVRHNDTADYHLHRELEEQNNETKWENLKPFKKVSDIHATIKPEMVSATVQTLQERSKAATTNNYAQTELIQCTGDGNLQTTHARSIKDVSVMFVQWFTEQVLYVKHEMVEEFLQSHTEFIQENSNINKLHFALEVASQRHSMQTHLKNRRTHVDRAVSPIRANPIKRYHCAVQTINYRKLEVIKKQQQLLHLITTEEQFARESVINKMEMEARVLLQRMMEESIVYGTQIVQRSENIAHAEQTTLLLETNCKIDLCSVLMDESNARHKIILEECNSFNCSIQLAHQKEIDERKEKEKEQMYINQLQSQSEQLTTCELKISELQEQLAKLLLDKKQLTEKYINALKMPTVNIVHNASRANDGTNWSKYNNNNNNYNDGSIVESELPVHRRFARAHQEALKVVLAQRQFC